jgi:hypothetical protein
MKRYVAELVGTFIRKSEIMKPLKTKKPPVITDLTARW